jgi:hypothetical protein
LSITADDTSEQTKRVMRATARYADPDPPAFEEWHTLQHWLEDGVTTVHVPYATKLAELVPPIATRLRRDFGTLLSLVRAHALLHRATRQIINDQVVATLDDYAAVRELVADVISDTLGQAVTPATREVVQAVAEILDDDHHKHATYAQLTQRLGLDKSSVSRRARVAVYGGYLRNEEDRRGKPARLVLGDDLPEDVVVLPTVDQIECCTVAPQSGPPPTQGVRATSTPGDEALQEIPAPPHNSDVDIGGDQLFADNAIHGDDHR